MKNQIFGGALALPLVLAAAPAWAQDNTDIDDQTISIIALDHRPDSRGPAGMMGDHVHPNGEWMIGLSWMHMHHSGANFSGTEVISDADILAAGYPVRTQSMDMDMAMLHVMYAPNDTLTFTLMPSWNRMEMTMLGIDPMAGMGMMEGAHHMLTYGDTMTHSISGIGDTKLGVLVRLSDKRDFAVHAGLNLSIPTGSVSRTNAGGSLVHYGMQPGSGTWDLEPSITVKGLVEGFGWGAQVSYLARLEEANESGFSFGDKFAASAWLSKPLSEAVSLSARLAFSAEGAIEGHYNGGHAHASPPDRQANYGGQAIEAGLGANVLVADDIRLGAEVTLPFYQDLNGIQVPRDFGLNISLAKMF